MAGFRAEFSKMTCDSSDDDDDDDGPSATPRKATTPSSKPALATPRKKTPLEKRAAAAVAQGAAHVSDQSARLSALRDQKTGSTWQTTEVGKEAERSVDGFRLGSTNVRTPAGKGIGRAAAATRLEELGGAAALVDSAAKTRYGAALLAQAKAYEGPVVLRSATGPPLPTPFVLPPPLNSQGDEKKLLLPRDDPGKAGALILDEVNACRRDPRAYVAVLERHRAFYDGTVAYPARRSFFSNEGTTTPPPPPPPTPTPTTTTTTTTTTPTTTHDNNNTNKKNNAGSRRTTAEGAAALDEAIAALKKATPAPTALVLDPTLATAAAAFLTAATTAKHEPPSLAPYGLVEGAYGHVVAHRALYADEALVQLLVCDGDKSRRARRRVLEPKMSRAGAAAVVVAEPGALDSHAAADGTAALLLLCQSFRPAVDKPAVVTYQGLVPIKDEAFVQTMLTLPSPLPRDITRHIKAGAKVTIDYQVRSAAVTVETASGTTEHLDVSLDS